MAVTEIGDIDAILRFTQDTLALTPVIILGSGASAAHGVPGMWPLSEHLAALPAEPDWDAAETQEWEALIARLAGGADLEGALGAGRFTERQTARVADATRSLLLPADEAVFAQLLAHGRTLPLTRLYRHLFTSTHPAIDVITPNYDRIAEYAADAGDFGHFNGFAGGYLQTRPRASVSRPPVPGSRTVRIWKVHGSLDWFQDAQHQIIGVRGCRETPAGYAPLIVTPGIDKYRLTHTEPFRTIFACSDRALETARSYFCVGYGFNDDHLQEKLVERCHTDSVPIVVITKELTPTTKAFLAGGRCRKYVALEDGPLGARAFTHDRPHGIDLAGPPIWQFGAFLSLTLGVSA